MYHPIAPFTVETVLKIVLFVKAMLHPLYFMFFSTLTVKTSVLTICIFSSAVTQKQNILSHERI